MATLAPPSQDTATGNATKGPSSDAQATQTPSISASAPPQALSAASTVPSGEEGTPAKSCTFSCRVQYASQEDAEMVQKSLSVDPELRPKLVTRKLSVSGSALVMEFAAVDARTLRSAVGTFCDLLGLATHTLEAFEKVER